METIFQKITLKTVLIGMAALLVLILSTGIFVFGLRVSSETAIFDGVYVNDIDIGGMSREAAQEALQNEYDGRLEGKSMRLLHGAVTHEVLLDDICAVPDFDATVQAAYDIGRQGSIFQKMQDVLLMRFYPKRIVLKITYDEKNLTEVVDDFASAIEEEAVAFEIDEEKSIVKVKTHSTGQLIDTMATREAVLTNIGNVTFMDVSPVFVSDSDISERARLLAEKIQREPRDAVAIIDENGKNIAVELEQSGLKVDKAKVETALREGKEEFEVAVEVTPAEVTKKELEAILMVNLLSEFTTNYDASIIGRTQNVSKAAENINGYILAPGEVFSFNDVVGERTVETGFALGKVFVGNKVVDGIGGGICQVSSTLYNTALFADMEIVERYNHNFIVAYVPKGQDATVNYGTYDFRFKNNTEYPVKIEAEMGGGRLTVKLYGTAVNSDRTIKIENVTIETRPFGVVEQPNPNAAVTRRIVTQVGIMGATVDSYKIYYDADEEVERVFMHRSVYSPLSQIALVPAPAAGGETGEPITLPQMPVEPGDTLEEVVE